MLLPSNDPDADFGATIVMRRTGGKCCDEAAPSRTGGFVSCYDRGAPLFF